MGVSPNLDRLCDIARLLKTLSNDKRLAILYVLGDEEKSVTDILTQVDLSQSALSQHLARLRHDGIVKTRREAQMIYYSLDRDHVDGLACLDFLKQLCSCD